MKWKLNQPNSHFDKAKYTRRMRNLYSKMIQEVMFYSLTLLSHVFLSVTTASVISEDSVCAHHFNHKLQKCMKTFVELYESKNTHGFDDLINKHLCFEYEKTLQCVHSALSNCMTHKNVQRVQLKLGADWVTGVNQLCSIQSEASKDSGRDSGEKDYLANTTDESEKTKSEIKSKPQNKLPAVSNEQSENHSNQLWRGVIKVRRAKVSRGRIHVRSEEPDYTMYNIITNYSSSATSLCFTLCLWTVFTFHIFVD